MVTSELTPFKINSQTPISKAWKINNTQPTHRNGFPYTVSWAVKEITTLHILKAMPTTGHLLMEHGDCIKPIKTFSIVTALHN